MLQGLGESQGGVSGKGLSQAPVQPRGLGEGKRDLARTCKVYAWLGPAGLRQQRWRPVSALGGAMEPRPAVGCATPEGPADRVRLGEERNWSGLTVCPERARRPPDAWHAGRVSAGELSRVGQADLWRQASRGEMELSVPRCGGLCSPESVEESQRAPVQ